MVKPMKWIKSLILWLMAKNKYDEMSESVDIMGNTTKYERDTNGNVIKNNKC